MQNAAINTSGFDSHSCPILVVPNGQVICFNDEGDSDLVRARIRKNNFIVIIYYIFLSQTTTKHIIFLIFT